MTSGRHGSELFDSTTRRSLNPAKRIPGTAMSEDETRERTRGEGKQCCRVCVSIIHFKALTKPRTNKRRTSPPWEAPVLPCCNHLYRRGGRYSSPTSTHHWYSTTGYDSLGYLLSLLAVSGMVGERVHSEVWSPPDCEQRQQPRMLLSNLQAERCVEPII